MFWRSITEVELVKVVDQKKNKESRTFKLVHLILTWTSVL